MKKFKKLIVIFIMIIFIVGLIWSITNIILWNNDNSKTNKIINDIQDKIKIDEKIDNPNTEIVNQDSDIDTSNPYWDYIKMNLISVDFNELKQTNNDTKGWIQVNGTNINYPFVQSGDNNYYLTHSFDKSYNSAGWIFLDYRNDINNLNKNTIIYAHGRYDGTMFGSLKNILSSGWLNNSDNYIVRLSTETENSLWQVFSVYKIPTTNDYLQTDFNDDEFKNFTDMLINRSSFDFNTNLNENDKILTLSTCYNDNEKVVLHAKLIKRELK